MACFLASPCSSSPCLNGAICQVYWNTTNTWFTCLCAGTFTGIRCETSLLNPCGGLCMNGYSLVFCFLKFKFSYFLFVEVHVLMEYVFAHLNILEHSVDIVSHF